MTAVFQTPYFKQLVSIGGKRYRDPIMFGKKFGEYVRFDSWILILVAAAFASRLAIGMTGVPVATTKWISINIVLLVGLIYCSIAVHTSGFGSYKQLFGLLFVQNAFAHFLIASGIALAIVTATSNIYTAPEFFGGSDGRNWSHVAAHFLGAFLVPVFAWLIGSAILFITKKVKPA
jgi:hypothetical protein